MYSMSKYKFFEYKKFIEGYKGEDFMGTCIKIYLFVAILTIILLCVKLRKCSHRKIDIYLKVLSIFIPIHEVIKIIWESCWDIKTGSGFNFTGLLPLYTCSLFIFILPFAAWCKGKVRESALSFLTTLSIFAGLTNFLMPAILNTYPFFTYATFVSLDFHFLMVFTGIFLVSTGYYVPKKLTNIILAWIPVGLFSILAYAANNIWKGSDYMLITTGGAAPLLPQISSFLNGLHLNILFTAFVLLLYALIIALMIGLYNLIGYINKSVKNAKLNKKVNN